MGWLCKRWSTSYYVFLCSPQASLAITILHFVTPESCSRGSKKVVRKEVWWSYLSSLSTINSCPKEGKCLTLWTRPGCNDDWGCEIRDGDWCHRLRFQHRIWAGCSTWIQSQARTEGLGHIKSGPASPFHVTQRQWWGQPREGGRSTRTLPLSASTISACCDSNEVGAGGDHPHGAEDWRAPYVCLPLSNLASLISISAIQNFGFAVSSPPIMPEQKCCPKPATTLFPLPILLRRQKVWSGVGSLESPVLLTP